MHLRILPLLFLFLACNSSSEKSGGSSDGATEEQQSMRASITQLEHQLKAKGEVLDVALGRELLSSYVSYSNKFHADTLASEFMMRGASLAVGLGKFPQAVELLINYYDGYPNSSRRAEAAFTVAFIYDEHLRNPDKAAQYYQAVIDNHPGTRYAQEAESALRLVGMTDEQLLEFLKSKNE